MKALILNALKREQSSIEHIYKILANELKDRGWKSETFMLQDIDISSCKGCFGCWTVTPGICVNEDESSQIIAKFIHSDLIISLTKVTFGGYSSELKKVFDRTIPILSPFFMKAGNETRHKPRYKKYPNLATIGVMIHPDDESEYIFKTLAKRIALHFHAPQQGTLIIFSGQSKEKIHEKIKTLLRTIGGE
ncbi:MAG: hypothetical protein A2Y62_02965 [Candidatus Fischerbacteria bacterium RBG_13_37_8]|uniref:NADPH-dependent FMN reductase-like domain-containing protein n=1 Tax=Candidatus Fischerbacteria bacterium RBG_13_37_8 TaxID=1817863 RepID=A0A1F5VE73_9BACT|nr:MAG: hypothetical protein A2Y62_02965 [Candidatus Fischerbacteria bacterium RBG_13_37_8]